MIEKLTEYFKSLETGQKNKRKLTPEEIAFDIEAIVLSFREDILWRYYIFYPKWVRLKILDFMGFTPEDEDLE